MAAIKFSLVLLACMVALSSAAPGWFSKGHHEHVVVHVPYNVHTHHVHHHHVEKIPIYKEVHVPVVKHVPIYKEVHVPIVKHVPVPVHVESKGWSSGAGWW